MVLSIKTNVLNIANGEFKSMTLISSDLLKNPGKYFLIGAIKVNSMFMSATTQSRIRGSHL